MKLSTTYAALSALALFVSVDGIAANSSSPAAARTQVKAVGPSHTTGQPNQSCGSASAPNTPGNAASASGSAFNPSGNAGTVYAGQQPENSRNPVSVSQYDAGCAHQAK